MVSGAKESAEVVIEVAESDCVAFVQRSSSAPYMLTLLCFPRTSGELRASLVVTSSSQSLRFPVTADVLDPRQFESFYRQQRVTLVGAGALLGQQPVRLVSTLSPNDACVHASLTFKQCLPALPLSHLDDVMSPTSSGTEAVLRPSSSSSSATSLPALSTTLDERTHLALDIAEVYHTESLGAFGQDNDEFAAALRENPDPLRPSDQSARANRRPGSLAAALKRRS